MQFENLTTLSNPPPILNGTLLASVRLGAVEVQNRCPGVKVWIDTARNLLVFGPERLGGSVLFACTVPLFYSKQGLQPRGFVGENSVDRVVDRLNSAKMPQAQKDALVAKAERDEKSAHRNRILELVEDGRKGAENFERWIKWNLNTESRYRRFMGI